MSAPVPSKPTDFAAGERPETNSERLRFHLHTTRASQDDEDPVRRRIGFGAGGCATSAADDMATGISLAAECGGEALENQPVEFLRSRQPSAKEGRMLLQALLLVATHRLSHLQARDEKELAVLDGPQHA
eukprot:CAMPEP_0180511100 /NCGR_PEP_ID=MMETSP1036_2-20121128/50792_1 /TAXON_ID=632150 /ORGANISM="Azadinium spinosum, Strain 3D9" /LENGTH=129 /DNA_ID=CAMNT_0022521985 /DNA_START=308 /DNA_END=694 /DNA_ORIENTATION=-